MVRTTLLFQSGSKANCHFDLGQVSLRKKKIILFEDLRKSLWFERHPRNLVDSLKQLNYCFKRILPARNIFDFDLSVPPQSQRLFSAAITDFKNIFVYSDSEDLVLCMISMFADGLISKSSLESVQESEDFEERKRLVTSAFRTFDIFARHLNYLFDQFSVNIVISRSGMVARQDDRITKENLYSDA